MRRTVPKGTCPAPGWRRSGRGDYCRVTGAAHTGYSIRCGALTGGLGFTTIHVVVYHQHHLQKEGGKMRRLVRSVLVGCLGAILMVGSGAAVRAEPFMRAHFIDVGQADATLLEFRCGTVLIDAGEGGHGRGNLVPYLTEFFRRRPQLNNTIDVLFVTHAHIDHTSALKEVVETFTVKAVCRQRSVRQRQWQSGDEVDSRSRARERH